MDSTAAAQPLRLHRHSPEMNYGDGRLKTSTVTGQATQSYSYDDVGNLTSKTYVGSYHYANSAAPHRVTSITLGTTTRTFHYDANGNITDDGIRQYQWTSHNKPHRIIQGILSLGGTQIDFIYGPDHQRIKQTRTKGATTTTILYFGDYEEEINSSGRTARHRLGFGHINIHYPADGTAPSTKVLYHLSRIV